MFELFSTYTFTTLAPAILGGTYKSLKVIAIMNFETAKTFRDVLSVNEQLTPVIPGMPVAEEQQYLLLDNGDEGGNKLVLSTSWVDDTTVIQDASISITITIDNASVSDRDVLRQLLRGLGYQGVNIT